MNGLQAKFYINGQIITLIKGWIDGEFVIGWKFRLISENQIDKCISWKFLINTRT